MAVQLASATMHGTSTVYADAITVSTFKELRAALRQQPPRVIIIVNNRTLVWLAVVVLFWFQGIPAMERVTNAAMEKAYGISWNLSKHGVELILTPPQRPLKEKPPQIDEE